MNNLKLSGRTIAIGVVVLLAVFLIGSQLLGGGGLGGATATPTPAPIEAADIQIGDVVSAAGVDRDGCPVNVTSTFAPTDSIYIVATNSDLAAGTDVFARLFLDNQPVEDSVVITADQAYANTCIYIVFEATDTAEVLDRGNYEAQLIINGNPGPTVDFQVQ